MIRLLPASVRSRVSTWCRHPAGGAPVGRMAAATGAGPVPCVGTALAIAALTASLVGHPVAAVAQGAAQASGRTASDTRSSIDRWRRANERQVLDEAFALFALPNLASDSVAIRRVATYLASAFTARGLQAELLESPTGGPPAVLAERLVPGATRTIVLYAHYDGQPTAGAPWDGDPFAPTLRRIMNGVAGEEVALPAVGDTIDPSLRIYARSASDDKGPIVAMLAALDALAAEHREPTVNVKIFLEGEEEAGSQHLGDMLRAHAARLQGDAWFFMDGPVHVSGAPQVVLGVRGVVGVEITLYGPNRPLHSGHYGNWAPNPAVSAAHLIASMRDRNGSITIADFHSDVRSATVDEITAARALSATDDSVRRSVGLSRTEAGNSALGERIMQPALNVRGIRAGGVGTSATNSIPTSATVSIDFRMVPDQRPERLQRVVNAHIEAQGYEIITEASALGARADRERVAMVRWGGGYRSVRTAYGEPAVQALQAVVRDVYDREPFIAPTLGGSLPLFHFADVFDAPLITLPTVNADNNQHAPNENLRVQNLWDAIALVAALMTDLSTAWDRTAVVP